MATTPRHNFFNTDDANRALDEYEAAFKSTKVFTENTGGSYPPEKEAEFARVIRKVIRSKTPMTETEILNMYGIIKHNFFGTADANRALDEYMAVFGNANVFYFFPVVLNPRPAEDEAEFARLIRRAIHNKTPMKKVETLNMYGIIKHNLFSTADANRALDEYEAAFGDSFVFYLRGSNHRPPEEEAEFACVIRRAIRNKISMTGAEILDMYGIIKDNFFDTDDANKALDEYIAVFGSANVFYSFFVLLNRRPPEKEAEFACVIRKAILNKTPMTDVEILDMYGISRRNLFSTADANRALDEYAEAFGHANVLYLLAAAVGGHPPEKEAEFARVIRKAISNKTPMTETEILNMYYFDYEKGVPY